MGLGKRRKLALLSTSRKIERQRFHEFNCTRESQQWRCRFLSRITTTPSRIVRLRTTFSSSTRSVGRSRFRAKRTRFFSRKSRWPIPARDTWPSLATRYSKIFAAQRARLRVAVRDDHEARRKIGRLSDVHSIRTSRERNRAMVQHMLTHIHRLLSHSLDSSLDELALRGLFSRCFL